MPNTEAYTDDGSQGRPHRRRIIKRLTGSGSALRIEYEDAILPEDLPEHMRMRTAVGFLAQHLGASPATLYRNGVAARIPVVYLKSRRLRDGTEKPSEMRVPREGLLQMFEDLVRGGAPEDG